MTHAERSPALLIILGGRSGAGKTTIARELARQLGGVHVRIDSIEQAIRSTGRDVEEEGYLVGYAVAADNLRLGRVVIADSVNPWPETRDAWRRAASEAGVPAIDVEIVCSDAAAHRHRIDSRQPDIAGHVLPTWQEVVGRDYRPWTTGRLVIETSGRTVASCVAEIRAALPGGLD